MVQGPPPLVSTTRMRLQELLARESYTSRKAAGRARVLKVDGDYFLEVDVFSSDTGAVAPSLRIQLTPVILQALVDDIDADRAALLARKNDLGTLKSDLQAL